MVDKKMYGQHEPSPGLAISSPALHFQGTMIHYYISAHQMKLINLRKQSRNHKNLYNKNNNIHYDREEIIII